jgi:hypothetical protein
LPLDKRLREVQAALWRTTMREGINVMSRASQLKPSAELTHGNQ